MKILFHIKSLSARGGAERAFVGLAAAMAERGHDVSISLYRGEDTDFAYTIPDTVRVVYLRGKETKPKHPPLWWRLLKLVHLIDPYMLMRHVAKSDYDVAVGWLRFGASAVGWLPDKSAPVRIAAMRNVPYGIGPPPPDKKENRLKLFLRKLGYNRADHIFVQMPQFRDMMPPKWQAKARVIPNAVIVPDEAGPDYASREKLVVAVARLVDIKRLDHLIRGFAHFHQTHPDWRLEIWGEDGYYPRQARLQDLIDGLGVHDHAALMGVTNDVEAVYARARVLAHPSQAEGMSNTVTEAMARALPVIVAADCQGMDLLVQPDQSGIMLPGPAADTTLEAQIADALARIADDPEAAAQMGQNARRWMQEAFSPQKIFDTWENELTSVVAQKSAKS